MSIHKQKQEWDELARLDPLWAILSDPGRKFGRWDVGEFFLTGEREIEEYLMPRANTLGYPLGREVALDFGCGVGRVARSLSRHFKECYGVDISERMIEQARQLNKGIPNCHFWVNVSDDLQRFPNGHFDLIYSKIVLQHMPERDQIRSYISEFVRILKLGGLLVFQLPSYIPLRHRFQPRRRLYTTLRRIGFEEGFLYGRLRLHPIVMNYIPESQVVAFLEALGAKILDVEGGDAADSSVQSRTYFVTR